MTGDDASFDRGTNAERFGSSWFLRAQSSSLLTFYEASVDWRHGGFWQLDEQGMAIDGPKHTFHSARMTYSYVLGAIDGHAIAADIVEHGLRHLRRELHDNAYGGWFHASSPSSSSLTKSAYDHAFIILAAASATRAGFAAVDLLDEALRIAETVMMDGNGLFGDEWARAWSPLGSYRGANANMHMMEALLAAFSATGQTVWLDRALQIGDCFVEFAERCNWRMPEHFDDRWQPDLLFNRDVIEDPFKPYGSTPGHALQWARLVTQASIAASRPFDEWLPRVHNLYQRALADGWRTRGGGILYTVDWDGSPMSSVILHWPVAEGIAASAVLESATADPAYGEWYRRLWAFAIARLIEPDRGWIHEQSLAGTSSRKILVGRPDLYHALQATMAARIGVSPTFAAGLANSREGGRSR